MLMDQDGLGCSGSSVVADFSEGTEIGAVTYQAGVG